MKSKEEGFHRLAILLGFTGVLIWLLFSGYETEGFKRIDSGGWWFFLGGIVVIFGGLFGITKGVYWVISGFSNIDGE